MGRHEEGKKHFDDVLAKEQRSFEVLVGISSLLREIGAVDEARKLAEEAHGKGVETKKKFAAALLRAVMYKDLDDNIAWLEQCDPSEPQVKADLGTARGQQALRKG